MHTDGIEPFFHFFGSLRVSDIKLKHLKQFFQSLRHIFEVFFILTFEVKRERVRGLNQNTEVAEARAVESYGSSWGNGGNRDPRKSFLLQC